MRKENGTGSCFHPHNMPSPMRLFWRTQSMGVSFDDSGEDLRLASLSVTEGEDKPLK